MHGSKLTDMALACLIMLSLTINLGLSFSVHAQAAPEALSQAYPGDAGAETDQAILEQTAQTLRAKQIKQDVVQEKSELTTGGGVAGNVLLFFILMLTTMVFIKLIGNKRKGQ